MNRYLRTLIQLILGVGIALVLLYITFRKSSVSELWGSIQAADPFWMAMGGITLLAMYFFRALRWQMMLEEAGHPAGLYAVTLSTLITYLVNSVTPKLGEVVRCSVLLRTDKVPIASSLGTVVSERVADTLVLLGGAGVVFLFEAGRLGQLFGQMLDNLFGEGRGTGLAVFGIVLAALAIGAIFFMRSQRFQEGILGRAQAFMRQAFAAARSVLRLRRPWLFVLHTVLIWLALILMNYFFMLALPATAGLGIYYAVLILFVGGIGWALPVPGGIGATHFIVLQVFLSFLGEAGREPGLQIGLLSNGATFIYNVGFGLLAWLAFWAMVLLREREQKSVPTAQNS